MFVKAKNTSRCIWIAHSLTIKLSSDKKNLVITLGNRRTNLIEIPISDNFTDAWNEALEKHKKIYGYTDDSDLHKSIREKLVTRKPAFDRIIKFIDRQRAYVGASLLSNIKNHLETIKETF